MLLKAVGLATALAGSGVIPPGGAGSRLPIFRQLYADIGDRQSIAASLSTFSAHVRMLRGVLEEADGRTLVLLDEIGSGTDPVEGASLAAATLVSLTRRGTVTLATTHLGALKELASREPVCGQRVAPVDADHTDATYRFMKGCRALLRPLDRRVGVGAATFWMMPRPGLPDAYGGWTPCWRPLRAERQLRAEQAAAADGRWA